MHWLKYAFLEGLKLYDTDELLEAIAKHITLKGEWETGIISPSLVATECRLARLKKFLGDDPQPGLKRLAVRAGKADAMTQLNFTRGFVMEAQVVAAITRAVGEKRIMGHAPNLLFRWRYRGDDLLLSMWKQGMIFGGHPDLMIWSPNTELELVQIKAPTVYKLERIERMGDEDALQTYRAQMITEIYIGRRMGYPIQRSHLLLASSEGTPKVSDPHCRIITLEWHESMATIPEEVARQVIQDYDTAYTVGEWPLAYPQHKWDSWPCSYCNYSRLGGFDTIGCEEQPEWDRFEKTGETRITAPAPDESDPKIVPLRRRRRKSA